MRLLDLVVMLANIHKAAADDEVGFEDTQETVDSITKRLNLVVFIDPNLIESGIWAANMLNEKGQYVHPKSVDFKDWVERLMGKKWKWSPIYGTSEER